MSFDEDPKDIENYPCPTCEFGIVTKHGSKWECDDCNFEQPESLLQEKPIERSE